MDNLTPKINLIYYKNILDNVFVRFFGDYNDSFTRSNGKYVFSGRMSRSSLKKKINAYFLEELDALTEEYDVLNPKFYFVIGSCFPCENMLLNHIPKENRLPRSLTILINEFPDIKYFLKEHDIHVDNEMFNCVFEEIFNRYFMNHNEIVRELGKKKSNIRFIKYNRLDCYSTYRMIKDLFGRINIVNMHKTNIDRMSDTIRSVNELIGSHVLDKKRICRDDEFKNIKEEMREYIENCMAGRI